ncbi:carbohydrate ABC transporter permease [Streptomyces odontomachi]|uniref:carbohydrate ABC transporter permease n=1 Tax=Streptomyces odontomachi TaxID=2944940 RepID=UPI00210EC13A|nr:carbohydrate ABC transporter permease [Streptomyces sp. ODS25]
MTLTTTSRPGPARTAPRPSAADAGRRAVRGRRLRKAVRGLVLAVASLVAIFPFYALIVLSLKPAEAIRFPESLTPWHLDGGAYAGILGAQDVLRWAANTAVYALVSVVMVLLLASMAGYAFAKKRFPGKEPVFWSFISMVMVPYHVTLVPTFILIAETGGVDTYWGLIIPTLANAQAVFLMRQFIQALPDELFEAARLDGCSEWRVYVSIVLPLTKPILATLGVFIFLWHWNDFLWPLVIGQSTDMRTLTTGIASLNQQNVPLNEVLAGSVVALVPIFLAYLVGQRYVQEGVVMSGIKG